MRITFNGKPTNYKLVDNFLSRSAQPEKDDFIWLKSQGVTDVINFRTRPDIGIDFDEKNIVENLGMKYHNIPSYTRSPSEEKIKLFLNLLDKISSDKGRVHIHCKAGADRTGMYAFIYKQINRIDDIRSNIQEWIRLGHHQKLFPDLIHQTQELLERLK